MDVMPEINMVSGVVVDITSGDVYVGDLQAINLTA
jgi:hypothetical protein